MLPGPLSLAAAERGAPGSSVETTPGDGEPGLAPGSDEVGPTKSPDELRREIDALREHISRLSAAIPRISATLDLGTVLREVVDSARALTGARYGVIATLGDAGQPREFVSSGLTPEEHQRLTSWSGGTQLFEHLRGLRGTLRLRDLPDYSTALGYLPNLMGSKTIQGAPMRHRGMQVGNFFLGGKEGEQEFTSEDEEVLVLFASQAATAIVNARSHRDEQRARADLEALVDTSPVGVLVFDARTGNPVVGQSGGQADCRGPLCAGPLRGATAGDHDDPARRRAGDFPPGVPPGAGAQQRDDGARRGDRPPEPRWPEGHDAGQRHADPFRGRRRRVRGRHLAGLGADRGTRRLSENSVLSDVRP